MVPTSLLALSSTQHRLSVGETRGPGISRHHPQFQSCSLTPVACLHSWAVLSSAVLWEAPAHTSRQRRWVTSIPGTPASPLLCPKPAPILFTPKQRANWARLLHPTPSHGAQLPSPTLPGAVAAAGQQLLPRPAQPWNFWLIAGSAMSPGFWPQMKGIARLSRIKRKYFYVSD